MPSCGKCGTTSVNYVKFCGKCGNLTGAVPGAPTTPVLKTPPPGAVVTEVKIERGTNACFTCNQNIKDGDEILDLGEHKFHRECFKCSECHVDLKDQQSQCQDGVYFCQACFIDKYLVSCRSCNQKITSAAILPALGGYYHPQCFVCVICKQPFTEGRFGLNAELQPVHPACKTGSVGGNVCSVCNKVMDLVDEVEVKPGLYMHQQCFKCTHCHEQLEGASQVHNNKVYCREDYINLFMNRCARCSEAILAQMATKPTGQTFHPECMKCSECGAQCTTLIGGFFRCNLHKRKAVVMVNCNICKEDITDPEEVVCCIGRNIHLNCFFCQICGEQLEYRAARLRKDLLCCIGCASRDPKADDGGLTRMQEQIRQAHLRTRKTNGGLTRFYQNASNEIKWQKGDLLGKGAFGMVYKGQLLPSGDTVAIKNVTPTNQEQREMIEKEIEVMSSLRHPNIVTLLGIQRNDDNDLDILMEYVPGRALDVELKTKWPLDDAAMRFWTKQLVSALVYCHGRNVIHRDLKGRNVLVNGNQLKICDFGSAALLGQDVSKATEEYNYTPLWTAPEILTGEYDNRVDIWSLGCVLIEMGSGKEPWAEEEFEHPFRALFTIGNTDKLPKLPDNISPGCKDFMLQCLQRDPSRRPDARTLLKHEWLSAK